VFGFFTFSKVAPVPVMRLMSRTTSASSAIRVSKEWQRLVGGGALARRSPPHRGRALGLGDGVGAQRRALVVEEELRPGLAQVPLEVVGEHAGSDGTRTRDLRYDRPAFAALSVVPAVTGVASRRWPVVRQ
jgi:hypothetical protein